MQSIKALQSIYLGMRTAESPVKSSGQQMIAASDDAADHRIGFDKSFTAGGQR